jgi:hypothetical protein
VAEHDDQVLALRRREQVAEMGIVLAYLPRSPFMHLTVVDAGIEAVVECASDAPEELERTLAVLGIEVPVYM